MKLHKKLAQSPNPLEVLLDELEKHTQEALVRLKLRVTLPIYHKRLMNIW